MNNSSNISPFDISQIYGSHITSFEFWLNIVLFLLTISTLGVITNTFLLLVIIRGRKSLWKHSYFILLTFHVSLKALNAFSTILFGIVETIGFYYPSLILVSKQSCVCSFYPIIFGEIFQATLLFFITTDRLVSNWKLVSLETFSTLKRVSLILGVCFSCELVLLGPTIPVEFWWRSINNQSDTGQQVVRCVNPLQKGPTISTAVLGGTLLSCGILNVLAYIIMMVGIFLILNIHELFL